MLFVEEEKELRGWTDQWEEQSRYKVFTVCV